jgi:carbonic anhydrase/acetyltransferase-like protein (isoleucine patch superfamily)
VAHTRLSVLGSEGNFLKKYELLKSDTVNYRGKTLYRIKYLIDIPVYSIEAGGLGGFLESENNLSHDGNCVVLYDALVHGNALVSGNAKVYGNARVFDNTRVYDNARVYGDAQVFGNARVSGDALVSDNAKVFGNAMIFGNAVVYGNAKVFGDAEVYGDAWFLGNAKVNSGKHKDINIAEDLVIRSLPLWKVLYGE